MSVVQVRAVAARREPGGHPAAGLAFAAGYGLFAQGAYHAAQTALFVGALFAAAAAARHREDASALRERAAVAALAMLGAGLLASTIATGFPREALKPFASLVAAAAALHIGVTIVRRHGVEPLVRLIAALGVIAAIGGLAGLAFHIRPLALEAQGIWRASTTLTYANAAGMLFALSLPAAMLLLRLRRERAVAARQSVFLIAAGLLATLSRGAIVGAFAMLCVLACTRAGRGLIAVAVRPGIAAAIATIAFLPTMASDAPRPWLAIAGVAAGAIVCGLPRPPRRVAIAATLALVVAGVALGGVAVRHAPKGEQLIRSRVARQSEDRLFYWRTAIDEGAKHPLFGSGPGTFLAPYEWKRQSYLMSHAHNEYLQAFAETGLIGVASIAAALVVLTAWAWRRRTANDAWIAAVAACAAFVAHSAFDFVWRLPLLVAIAFLWLAIATARADLVGPDHVHANQARHAHESSSRLPSTQNSLPSGSASTTHGTSP